MKYRTTDADMATTFGWLQVEDFVSRTAASGDYMITHHMPQFEGEAHWFKIDKGVSIIDGFPQGITIVTLNDGKQYLKRNTLLLQRRDVLDCGSARFRIYLPCIKKEPTACKSGDRKCEPSIIGGTLKKESAP